MSTPVTITKTIPAGWYDYFQTQNNILANLSGGDYIATVNAPWPQGMRITNAQGCYGNNYFNWSVNPYNLFINIKNLKCTFLNVKIATQMFWITNCGDNYYTNPNGNYMVVNISDSELTFQ